MDKVTVVDGRAVVFNLFGHISRYHYFMFHNNLYQKIDHAQAVRSKDNYVHELPTSAKVELVNVVITIN